MFRLVCSLFLLFNTIFSATALWDKETSCPLICTCRLEHMTETAIYRFIEKIETKEEQHGEFAQNNEVFNENDLNPTFGDTSTLRSVTCILQTETDPVHLLEDLPEDIETLALIQGYASGNKTIRFSHLKKFNNLVSLELLGPNYFNKAIKSNLICEIDQPLKNLKYLNLERILIKNSKNQIQKFVKEVNDEELTFEYIQKYETNSHPLTMVQKGTDEEVLPYQKFKEQVKINNTPLFIGFSNLLLLRITNCELNNVHWEMFDGLHNLNYLILEKNNLRFIPAFAFYGTPCLKSLSLAHNNLLDLQLTDLAGLLELQYLDLSFNNFSQLSELSLPPFPKLKLANFANNPISVIFPNTFEVMNTTDSLIIGSDDTPLSLTSNSFSGLDQLKELTLNNLQLKMLKKDLLTGMPSLKQLTLKGNITKMEFDTFLEVHILEKLVLRNCNIVNISMDAFMGLEKLEYLDLSFNKLEYIPPGTFDNLKIIKELYLNNNNFKNLPRNIFSKIHPKLLRLNENPWHCSCEMSEWKPMIINKLKQKVMQPCYMSLDKGIGCTTNIHIKYVFDTKIAPKCSEPLQFLNWSVFHAMKRLLKCPNYRPKIRKQRVYQKINNSSHEVIQLPKTTPSTTVSSEIDEVQLNDLQSQPHINLKKLTLLNNKFQKQNLFYSEKYSKNGYDDLSNEENNNLNNFNNIQPIENYYNSYHNLKQTFEETNNIFNSLNTKFSKNNKSWR